MRIVLVLLAGALLTYGLGRFAAGRYGDDVKHRFVERNTNYTATSLAEWVKANDAYATGYAFPMLFPIDLLFMAFLAGLLGFVSVRAAVSLPALVSVAPWFLLLPSLYLATDLAEDAILAALLTFPAAIDAATVTRLQLFTQMKIWSLTAALAQTVLLVLLAAKASLR